MKSFLVVLMVSLAAALRAAELALFDIRLDTISTERELMPQPGARLGSFGIIEVNETWGTEAEWMQTTGPNYAVFAARLLWTKPNASWDRR